MLSAGDVSNPPLVLLHGWGAGLAFFGRNIAGLAPFYRLHLLDWPGFGGSSRPYHSTSLSVDHAEAYFLDAFDGWVQHMRKQEPNFQRFHIVAHSMGAYLAAVYALRSPQNVLTLTLASPVGLPAAPPQKIPRGPLLRRAIFWIVFRMWDWGFTPQYFIRQAGTSLGRKMAKRFIEPRFSFQSQSTKDAFIEYFYQISVADAAGEHSLCTILESGAYARKPLAERMVKLRTPTSFLYGDGDWMSFKYAEKVCEQMKAPATVHIVEGAGHHVYYDNVQMFTKLILESCGRVSEEMPKSSSFLTDFEEHPSTTIAQPTEQQSEFSSTHYQG
ncbi:hypothetical protein FGB62_486g02 [Gracilaria domingensis]|nr:hypothetical protein FGB62_486g02 [Gracilaria domingensis]